MAREARRTFFGLGDFAAQVLEGARGFLDERVRFLAAAEDVRAGADGLDPHRPDRIDVAFHDELIPERQAPERHDLAAVLPCGAREVVVYRSPAAGACRSRGPAEPEVAFAHNAALRAACAIVCWSA